MSITPEIAHKLLLKGEYIAISHLIQINKDDSQWISEKDWLIKTRQQIKGHHLLSSYVYVIAMNISHAEALDMFETLINIYPRSSHTWEPFNRYFYHVYTATKYKKIYEQALECVRRTPENESRDAFIRFMGRIVETSSNPKSECLLH